MKQIDLDNVYSEEYRDEIIEMFRLFIGEQKITKGRVPQSKLVIWNESYGHKLSKPIKFITVWKKNEAYGIQSNATTKRIDSLYSLNNSVNVIVNIVDSHYCLLKNSSKLSITKKVKLLEEKIKETKKELTIENANKAKIQKVSTKSTDVKAKKIFDNVYIYDLETIPNNNLECFAAGYINLGWINYVKNNNLNNYVKIVQDLHTLYRNKCGEKYELNDEFIAKMN